MCTGSECLCHREAHARPTFPFGQSEIEPNRTNTDVHHVKILVHTSRVTFTHVMYVQHTEIELSLEMSLVPVLECNCICTQMFAVCQYQQEIFTLKPSLH